MWVLVSRFWFGHVRCPRTALPGTALPGPPFPGPPKISLFFFSLSRRKIRSFLPSPEVLSLNFVGVWKRQGRQMCKFGLSGCCVKPRRFGGAGVSHEKLQTCTFEGPGLRKHHQNSTRRPPEREKKNEFCGGRGEKKKRNFRRSQEGRSQEGRSGGTEHDQTKTLKATPTRETPLHETVTTHSTTHSTAHSTHSTHSTHTKSKSVLVKVGHDPSATLNELRDPERRPSRLSEAIPLEISRFWPQHRFQLDQEKCACNLCSAGGSQATPMNT